MGEGVVVTMLTPTNSFLPLRVHCMQGCLATRKLSVCPLVCLCDRLYNACTDKTEEKYERIFMPYEKSFSLVFEEKKWSVEATPST